jgi:elongation factor G
VGPYLSGKTTLLEAILHRTGALERQGSVRDGSTVGDAAPEARAHGMSVEINTATANFLGDAYTFLDCPGSIEFMQEAHAALAGCDAAVVVCEPDDKKAAALQLILKELDKLKIPRFLFLNKIDRTDVRVRDVLAYLQPASSTPLVLRQIPIWKDEQVRWWASSTSPSSAASSTARMVRARSSTSRAISTIARRKPASPCWRSSPTTMTR